MKHYMEQFQSPEEYILHRICLNMGTKNCIAKARLLELAQENGILVSPDAAKVQIAQIVMREIGAEALAKECQNMGVSGYNFQQKFGITRNDVTKLAEIGFLQVTGMEPFRAYGKQWYARLYSVWQYFSLTRQDIQKQLKMIQDRKNQQKPGGKHHAAE